MSSRLQALWAVRCVSLVVEQIPEAPPALAVKPHQLQLLDRTSSPTSSEATRKASVSARMHRASTALGEFERAPPTVGKLLSHFHELMWMRGPAARRAYMDVMRGRNHMADAAASVAAKMSNK